MNSIFFAAAIALLAGTGLATAQQAPAMHEGHLGQLDTNKDGGVSQAEYQTFMTESFTKLDRNADGVLVESEVREILSPRQIAATDANKDGRISQDEFLRQVMSDFARADSGGDGHLK